jgi:hypothetical protein
MRGTVRREEEIKGTNKERNKQTAGYIHSAIKM